MQNDALGCAVFQCTPYVVLSLMTFSAAMIASALVLNSPGLTLLSSFGTLSRRAFSPAMEDSGSPVCR